MFVTHMTLCNKHTDRQHRCTTLFSLQARDLPQKEYFTAICAVENFTK